MYPHFSPSGKRTRDLPLAGRLLLPLSYGGTRVGTLFKPYMNNNSIDNTHICTSFTRYWTNDQRESASLTLRHTASGRDMKRIE